MSTKRIMADENADQRGEHTDQQRHAHGLHAAGEQVAPETVRAEPV
jgi:hypothetical protein